MKLINAAPIKKIAEAKARKKRKVCLKSFSIISQKKKKTRITDFMLLFTVDDEAA